MENKVKCFDGSGNIKTFLEKVKLHSALKGFSGEKAAQNLASCLEGRTFDVYMRLDESEKKNEEKIRKELLKEFERGNSNRDTAIAQLNSKFREKDESAKTFAFNILELTKLAYPDFEDAAVKVIAKDYFINGLNAKMQIALKSMKGFDSADIITLADETLRLEIAGVESFDGKKTTAECFEIQESKTQTMVDMIAEKVIEKMKFDTKQSEEVNFAKQQPFRGQRRPRWQINFPRNTAQPAKQQSTKQCRACQSTEHFVRDCPVRFCQACGGKGHDAWEKHCPKYQ